MALPPGLDDETATRYSRDQLWNWRRFLLDGDGGPMQFLTLEAVPADEAAANRRPQRQDRQDRKQKPIGPIMECLPVDSEILKAKRNELRQIEKATGCVISEKAGLRNFTVIIQGTMAIVEKALPLVEAALSGEEEQAPPAQEEQAPPAQPPLELPPEPPPDPPSSVSELEGSAGPPTLSAAVTAPPRPAPPPPADPPPAAPSGDWAQAQPEAADEDEDWEIPAHWGSPTGAQANVSAPQEASWWHNAAPARAEHQQNDTEGFWSQQASDTPYVQSTSSTSDAHQTWHGQDDRGWWNSGTWDEAAPSAPSGRAAEEEVTQAAPQVTEVPQEVPRVAESRMAGRWRQNRATPAPTHSAPAPPLDPRQELPDHPPPAFHPPIRGQQDVFEQEEDEDEEFLVEVGGADIEDFDKEVEAAALPVAPAPPAASNPTPHVVESLAPAPSVRTVTLTPPTAQEARQESLAPAPCILPDTLVPPAARQAEVLDETRQEITCDEEDVRFAQTPMDTTIHQNVKEKKPAQQPMQKAPPAKHGKSGPTPKPKPPERKVTVKAPPPKFELPEEAEEAEEAPAAERTEKEDEGWESILKDPAASDALDDAMWDEDPFSTWDKSSASQPQQKTAPVDVPMPLEKPLAKVNGIAVAKPPPSVVAKLPPPVVAKPPPPSVVAKPPPPVEVHASPDVAMDQATATADILDDDLDLLEEDGSADKSKRKKKKKKKKGETAEEPAETPKAAAKVPAKAPAKAAPAKSKAGKVSGTLQVAHSHKTAFMGLAGDDSESDEEDDAPTPQAAAAPAKAASPKAGPSKGASTAKAARNSPAASSEAPKASAHQKATQPVHTVAAKGAPEVKAKPVQPSVMAKPPPPLAEAHSGRPMPPPPPQPSVWSNPKPLPAETVPSYVQDAHLAARLQMEINDADDMQIVGPHATRQDSNEEAWGQIGNSSRPPAAAAGRGGAASAKASAVRKEVSFAVNASAKAPKPKPAAKTQAVKALNPLPQRNTRVGAGSQVLYSQGMAISPDNNDNAASSRKWAERPVERLAPTSRQEEEDDPELACYLWDRRAQKPLRDQARRAPAPVQAPPVFAKTSPAPNPQKQRSMLTKVCEMGFDEQSARRALTQCGWAGVEEALGLLLG